MAILGRFECQVLVNGEPLHEYEDKDAKGDHDNAISEGDASSRLNVKYIKADANAYFAIRTQVKPRFRFGKADYLGMSIFIDGQFVGGPVLVKGEYLKTKNRGWSNTRLGVRSGNDTQGFELRRFRFGDIVTSMQMGTSPVTSLSMSVGEVQTSPNVEELKLKCAPLGAIKVEIWRKKTLSISRSGTDHKLRAEGVIPEKMLKGRALTLKTSLGEAEKNVSASRSYRGNKLDEHPIAAFVFKYRSEDALKQLLVIPRTRSPTPLEERPIERLSVEELRERLRRGQAEAEAMRARVKKERAESNLHTLRAVKRFREDMGVDDDDDVEAIAERSAHKRQRPVVGQEVIELSD